MFCPPGGGWAVRLLLLLAAFGAISGRPAWAQRPPAPTESRTTPATTDTGAIHGSVTTQQGTIPLGGVVVSLVKDGAEIANVASEADGAYRFDAVPAGNYILIVAAQGFDALSSPVTVAAAQTGTYTASLR